VGFTRVLESSYRCVLLLRELCVCVCARARERERGKRERKQRVGEKGRGTRGRGRRKRSESPPLLEEDQKKSPERNKRDREESRNPGFQRGEEGEESVAREICADELGGGRRLGGEGGDLEEGHCGAGCGN
jgi:hypothetical protein